MEIRLGYNTVVNKALEALGSRKNGSVVVHPERVQQAETLVAALKDEVLVRATATTTLQEQGSIRCLGCTVAKASGRDSGAWIPPGVIHCAGTVTSGGSRKNWHTEVRQGAAFEMRIPRIIFEKYGASDSDWTVTLVEVKEASALDLIEPEVSDEKENEILYSSSRY